MNDFEKWMLLPKFRVKVIDNVDLGKYLQITYGDLKNEKDTVNSCIAIEEDENFDQLPFFLECSLNSLLKVYHIGVRDKC